MRVVHLNWANGGLHAWVESGTGTPVSRGEAGEGNAGIAHPRAMPGEECRRALAGVFAPAGEGELSRIELALPVLGDGAPAGDPRLALRGGLAAGVDAGAGRVRRFAVETVCVRPADALAFVEAIDGLGADDGLTGFDEGPVAAEAAELVPADSVRFFAAATRFVRHLLAQQRFVPSLVQEAGGGVRGLWQLWLGDAPTIERARVLLGAMPPAVRAVAAPMEDAGEGGEGAAAEGGTAEGVERGVGGQDAWSVLQDYFMAVGDALCRRVLIGETMEDAITGRKPAADAHVAWLTGLLGRSDAIEAETPQRNELLKRVYRWISSLEERGADSQWRLLLRIEEPLDTGGLADLAAPGEEVRWTLTLHLQSQQSPSVVIDASDIWLLPAGAATVEGHRIEAPQDVLLAELGRAARLYKAMEKVLDEPQPSELKLGTAEAYQFLREVRPLLQEQGFEVIAPKWWETPTLKLGARLRVESDPLDVLLAGEAGPQSAAGARLGLKSLVSYRWELAIGEIALTLQQFQKLAAQHSPLVKLGGEWVEIRPDDVRAAMEFLKENPGGEMPVSQLMRLAYGHDPRTAGIPILGMEATGWVGAIFGDPANNEQMPLLVPPETFIGSLRPYQAKGLSWLAFLDRFGLGACLADDMGLGKTVQLLALLAWERAYLADNPDAQRPGPTLLVVPMSVVGNWIHETRRFTPNLRVLVHHGLTRLQGEALIREGRAADLVITTYALAHRDRESLGMVEWARIVLDEAQNIKNPTAKQTQAVRSIPADRRIALTGTPVENRLAELWSIMDFLNPGYLGGPAEFKTRFAVPIERYHDTNRSRQLRGLVQPFILRRLKNDPTVIADLPEKLETKEYCFLTPEQASLYRTCVSDMLSAAENAEGMHRRGLVLAGLIKLKQICNHPAQFFKEFDSKTEGIPAPERSGKCLRLVEMLREVVTLGDQALVFTQFRQMGTILAAMLRGTLGRDVLFLHGGTPAAARQEMIRRFQAGDGSTPIFILSLKAGGVGLNLTAANHVFHFDRWWNPAVEAQATDRAYRIGQTRTVQVHKFIVSGTLEERIDQMIEQKTELAQQVVGSGEQWLTELDTQQLRDLLALRPEAIEDPGSADDDFQPDLPLIGELR